MRLKLYAKCDDRCGYSLTEDGKSILDTDGYPPYIPGITGTDSVHIEIDLETGTIVGFNKEQVACAIADILLEEDE